MFLLVAAAFVAVPGPSNLFVLGRGLQGGARAAVAGATGCATGALTYVVATAAGLSALIASSQTVFATIHYAGAAYLCWLGVSALRTAHDGLAPDVEGGPTSIRAAYRHGVIVELGNPKVALFFLALFPQFVHRTAGAAWLQILVLGAIFVTVGLLSDCAYAVGSGRIRGWLLRRPGRMPRQQRMTGLLYIGLGLWAALAGADRITAMTDYGHDVEFGVFITPASQNAETVVALSTLADRAGLDLVSFQDHPYQARFLDAWTLLSFVAARTSRVRLSANVLNLPLRNPAVVARAVASLDILSGGRAELGIGAGAFWDGIEAMGGPA